MHGDADLNWYTDEIATFGDRVAAARDARDLTVKALAHRLGVATKTVDGWENDVSEPRANKLQMLSGVLDVSIPWLLTGDGPGVQPDPAEAAEVGDVLLEIRTLRAEMMNTAERLARLEKRIRQAALG
jgi:transcriptional regulator with XRE-family HTH domain